MKKKLPVYFLFAIPIVYAKLFKQIKKNFAIWENWWCQSIPQEKKSRKLFYDFFVRFYFGSVLSL